MIKIYTFDNQRVFSGVVECNPYSAVPRGTTVQPPNTIAPNVAVWNGAEWRVFPEYPQNPSPPAPIPQAVSMRQARLALLAAGLLDLVETAIAGAGPAAKIEWDYATEVQSASGLVPAMATALGLTDAQIDALFVTAATL